MKDSVWLIITKSGIDRMVRGGDQNSRTRPEQYRKVTRPALKVGEQAMLISVEVPGSVFEPKPDPHAIIVVPESRLVAPTVSVTVEEPPAEAAGVHE